MKTLLLTCLIAASLNTFAQLNAKLSQQIDSLKTEDQKPAMLGPGKAPAEFQKVIRSNFPLVKSILDTYGFPGYDLVGEKSSDNFWILVQHSDFDVPFQKRALALMKIQLDKNNASGQSYAYLIDRIELNEGRKQVYGTQVQMSPAGTKIKPCIDSLNLDSRRTVVGLMPIKDYLKQCDEAYYQLNHGTFKANE